MDQFRDELRKGLLLELAPSYPQLPDLNRETVGALDPVYRDSVFQFLDAAEKASEAQQPAMLLAADFMLQALWCPSEQGSRCDQLRSQFSQHHLTFSNSQLGGEWYYQHDLLWRVWEHFSSTQWGERAFILLLDFGWDTSGMCAKGSDQFRQVIRHGEAFLQQHPNSEYRGFESLTLRHDFSGLEILQSVWQSVKREACDFGTGVSHFIRHNVPVHVHGCSYVRVTH